MIYKNKFASSRFRRVIYLLVLNVQVPGLIDVAVAAFFDGSTDDPFCWELTVIITSNNYEDLLSYKYIFEVYIIMKQLI